MTELFEKSRWVRDLMRYLPLKSQFVLSGNIRDQYPVELSPGIYTSQALVPFLSNELGLLGIDSVLAFDPIHGFRQVQTGTGNLVADTELLVELKLDRQSIGEAVAGLDLFSQGLERVANKAGKPIVLIADFASRIINRPDSLTASEQKCFTRALVLSHEAKAKPYGSPPKPFYNTIIWIVDKEGDLPDWFVISNPRIRHISIPKPDHIVRRQMASYLLRTLEGYKAADEDTVAKAVKTFVDNTEGLVVVDLNAICQLSRSEGIELSRIGDAVRHYKLGVTEDPWSKIDRQKVVNAGQIVGTRVKGQKHAVVHMLDIVKRAVTGVGATGRGGRPRGVAFLAGPTGVGKTELAKTITSMLFGDDSAYIRFDMSEFSAEHSDQRLIGAPPGYVGYDVGGELTNAIREKPFSVVLFDEIEKAHPRILDKFLQILDDGVLTSGRGDRVYFSEAFIIFTSNLGIYKINSQGERVAQVTQEDDFDTVSKLVRSEIEQHFKVTLGRPEILNRIGENIIVFDFIRPEVADEIFEHLVANTLEDLFLQQKIHVAITNEAKATLHELVLTDLSNGGRGIRNRLEAHLLNPLARAFFDQGIVAGNHCVVESITAGNVTSLLLTSTIPLGTAG